MPRVHYVEFISPGTFVHETSRERIDTPNRELALELSKTISERHGARPFAFVFVTMLEMPPVDDGEGGQIEVRPKEVERSDRYFIGGKVLRFEEIPDNPENYILRENMRGNNIPLVVENRNSFRSFQPFKSTDNVIDPATGEILVSGSSLELEEYRKTKIAEWDAER